MPHYRRSAMQTCPRCGHRDEPAAFFHSGDGLVCEACHRLEKSRDRTRSVHREGSVDAMLNGLLSPACAVGCALFAFLVPEGPIPSRAFMLFAFGLAVVTTCIVRAFRFPNEIRGARAWRFVASAGGVLSLVSLVELASRLRG